MVMKFSVGLRRSSAWRTCSPLFVLRTSTRQVVSGQVKVRRMLAPSGWVVTVQPPDVMAFVATAWSAATCRRSTAVSHFLSARRSGTARRRTAERERARWMIFTVVSPQCWSTSLIESTA
jgi:hypothetical protein